MSLRLEGRLAGPWIEELSASCHQMSVKQRRCVMIDLTGVTFIDAEGKALLTRLWQAGVELRASGCLTRCVIEEIRGGGRFDSSSKNDDKVASRVTQHNEP
ncbi:MAG: hypothetical protein KF722_10900 [Nitrospira sp.]|nr:hypothetical protein [Nitrospira sp.]